MHKDLRCIWNWNVYAVCCHRCYSSSSDLEGTNAGPHLQCVLTFCETWLFICILVKECKAGAGEIYTPASNNPVPFPGLCSHQACTWCTYTHAWRQNTCSHKMNKIEKNDVKPLVIIRCVQTDNDAKWEQVSGAPCETLASWLLIVLLTPVSMKHRVAWTHVCVWDIFMVNKQLSHNP